MKPNKIKIHKIKTNPKNPRIIKDGKFKKLVQSIKDFPEMLKLRPIVVDENNIILGGNMRYKACIEAGLKEIYVIQADDLSDVQKRQFVIKDNVGFGEWDWDILANTFDNKELTDWGLDVWQMNEDQNLEDFFNEEIEIDEKEDTKIVLNYNKEDYDTIIELFNKLEGSKESIVKNLLLGGS